MSAHVFEDVFIPHQGTLPPGLPEHPSVRQSSHAEGGRKPPGSSKPDPELNVEQFVMPGFRALDEAMRDYWSGIHVPHKDGFRTMRVKVAGGNKGLLIWADELAQGGRALLPLAALDRSSFKFNQDKYSPAFHPMTARYISRRGDRVAKVFRPVPFLVEYALKVWAEHKRDAEHILYQVMTRFNPLAEFRMYDGHLQGTVTLRNGGWTDASDKEVGAEQHANVRYEFSMTAEAWLPLPEIIVPTVLGRTVVLQEKAGEILLASRTQADGNAWFEPIQEIDV